MSTILAGGPKLVSKQPVSGGIIDLNPPVINLNTIPIVTPIVRCRFSGVLVGGSFTKTVRQGLSVVRLGLGVFRAAFILQSTVEATFAPLDALYAIGASSYQDLAAPTVIVIGWTDYSSKTRFGFDLYMYNVAGGFTPFDPPELDVWVIA